MRSYMSVRGLQNNRLQSKYPTLCFKGPEILTLRLSALFFGVIVSNWVCQYMGVGLCEGFDSLCYKFFVLK